MKLKQCFHTGLLVAAATLSARAGIFSNDFNSGVPAGATLYGNAAIAPTGGTGGSGCLKVVTASNLEQGSIVLDDLDSGAAIYGFDVAFDLLLGGGTPTPADGFSVCFAPDLPAGGWGEEGTGSGLRFCFDVYDNGNESPPAPDFDIAVGPGGTKIATHKYNFADLLTWPNYQHVHIRVNADGSMEVDYKGLTLFTNYFFPGYQALQGQFGIGARTGGLNENCWIDNLQITTFLQPMVGISLQPFAQAVLQGDQATFVAGLSNPDGVTVQWYKNGAPITGANAFTLVLPSVTSADAGNYKLVATGPNNVATSAEVPLTIVKLTLPSPPQLAFNFDDGAVPANTAVLGTALVDTTGGVNNSGALKLTQAQNGQYGAFVISDPDAGAPVYGFTARFKTLVGGGTAVPADGWAFAFGTDIPADPTAGSPMFEEGAGLGTGLRVSFDIYNNDPILGWVEYEPTPAPSIDVRYGSQIVATVQMPITFMETGTNIDGTPAWDDTIIQLNNDGTLNVVYRGDLVFSNLVIPGFASFAGAQYAWAGRTGGLNDNIWFDNIQLTTVTTSIARITSQPASQMILVNHAVTFTAGVADSTGVTYQWSRGGSPITGANASSYAIPAVALTDDQAVFTVQVSRGGTSVTSTPATLTVVNLTAPASPTLAYTFDDGLIPASTAIYGNAYVTGNGGTGDSGCLHMTDALNGQSSAFVMQPIYGGAQLSGIGVAFDVNEFGGGSVPADGFSFNWAASLSDGVVGGAETGTGNGLSLCFRIYVGNGNADTPPSPYLGIKYNGAWVASTQIPAAQLDTGGTYRTMLLRVDPNGKLYLAYGEKVLYNGLQLPNYTFMAGKFGFYARTGGADENQWFDNIRIQATKSSGPLTIVTQPANTTVLLGQTASFSVTVSDPTSVTYAWYKNSTVISGAVGAAYTTPATTTADNGARFCVVATGPGGKATSSNAVLTVAAPITISNPLVSYDFDDGLVPDGTTVNGSGGGGYVASSGGVGNSGCLHLTDSINSQGGTFIIPDLNSNVPVKAFTVYFAANISGGTVPPADGISLSFASSNEVPTDVVVGEGGIGTGLIVIFDLYNGANPYFGITYGGTPIVATYVPYSALETGGNYADTFIRLNANGTVDVQFKGNVIFYQVPLPGYAAVTGHEFVFGGRTGGLNENQWLDNIQIATTTGLVPVPIAFNVIGTSLELSWNGDGFKLQSTGSLKAPVTWTDVGTSPPYYVPMIGPAQYYRLAPAP